MSNSNLATRAIDDANMATDANPAASTEIVVKEPASRPILVIESDKDAAVFGSAEKSLDEEVSEDIKQCYRANGTEEIFESQEERIRRRLPAAYKCFRRAIADPAYCAVLAKKLVVDSSGEYRPSVKKPANLATHMALRPKADRHVKQAYDAAYYYHHARIADISIESFATWIEGRNLKESRDFVRSRKKVESTPKTSLYPNLAKARTLKKDAEVAKILKEAKDLAETELAALFASRDDGADNAGAS